MSLEKKTMKVSESGGKELSTNVSKFFRQKDEAIAIHEIPEARTLDTTGGEGWMQ